LAYLSTQRTYGDKEAHHGQDARDGGDENGSLTRGHDPFSLEPPAPIPVRTVACRPRVSVGAEIRLLTKGREGFESPCRVVGVVVVVVVDLGEDPAFEGLQEVVMVAEKGQIAGKSLSRPL
jgi:hypothetical protein